MESEILAGRLLVSDFRLAVLVRSLLAGVALFAMTAAPVFADSLFPAAGQLWPNDYLHFFSEDMRPVQVTLRRDMSNDDKRITISLPRAWIIYASGYDPLRLNQLPDSLETSGVTIALADPDGAPLSIRSRAIAKDKNISWGDAIKLLRADEYKATLRYVPAGISTEAIQYGLLTRRENLIERDGLNYDPKEGEYLGQIGSDWFLRARCTHNPNPITFCYYYARPGKSIVLGVDFLDFRLHGGPGYANKRMQKLLETLCNQIKPACKTSEY